MFSTHYALFYCSLQNNRLTILTSKLQNRLKIKEQNDLYTTNKLSHYLKIAYKTDAKVDNN